MKLGVIMFTQLALSGGRFCSVNYDFYPAEFTPCDEPDRPESVEINSISRLDHGDETNIDINDISDLELEDIGQHCLDEYRAGCY